MKYISQVGMYYTMIFMKTSWKNIKIFVDIVLANYLVSLHSFIMYIN